MLAVRELTYGMWAVSAAAMLYILAYYILRNADRWTLKQRSDVWFAVAFWVMIFGHFLRAGVEWISYALLPWGEDYLMYMSTVFWFPLSILVIFIGKVFVVWSFLPERYRVTTLTMVIVASLVIPVLVYLFI